MDNENKLAPNNTLQNEPCYDVDYDGHMPPEIIDVATRGPAIALAILFSLIVSLVAVGFVIFKGIMWILNIIR